MCVRVLDMLGKTQGHEEEYENSSRQWDLAAVDLETIGIGREQVTSV